MSEHEHISKYWQATGVNFVVIQEEKTEKKTEIKRKLIVCMKISL